MSAAIACRLRQRLVVISPNLTRHPSIHSSPNRQLYHRATVDAVVMMAWFWFSYIPMAVSLLVNPEFVDELTPGRAPKVADLVVLFLVLNSVVGPFLYVWRLLDLKKNLDR
nr:hypothetical protein BaRGS_029420 [Batillaria attramentaria]